jgi:hypothetical protein
MWCERGRRGLGHLTKFEEATGNWDLLYLFGGFPHLKHLLKLHRNDWIAIYLERRPFGLGLHRCMSVYRPKHRRGVLSEPYSSATRTRGSSIGFNKRIPLTHNLWATNIRWWGEALCKFREGSYWVARLFDTIADREKWLDCNSARPVIKVIYLHFSLTCGKSLCSWEIKIHSAFACADKTPGAELSSPSSLVFWSFEDMWLHRC